MDFFVFVYLNIIAWFCCLQSYACFVFYASMKVHVVTITETKHTQCVQNASLMLHAGIKEEIV